MIIDFILHHKTFRISPEESKDEKSSSNKRRGKSAPLASGETSRHMDKVRGDGGVQNTGDITDPLEPWSTKDIKSINNLLDNSDRE